MLDYTITNTALIKLHVHVTKHRGVEVKKCLWGWTFHFHFIFSISVYCQYYLPLIVCSFKFFTLTVVLKKTKETFSKPSQVTSDSKMSPQTSNTIHRTDSVNAKCGYFQEIVKFAPHSTLLLIPQLLGHLLPFHFQ